MICELCGDSMIYVPEYINEFGEKFHQPYYLCRNCNNEHPIKKKKETEDADE
jgi:hypothetical protein